MRGKARRDSSVLVLLAPPGEYDWMIRQLPQVRNMIYPHKVYRELCPVCRLDFMVNALRRKMANTQHVFGAVVLHHFSTYLNQAR